MVLLRRKILEFMILSFIQLVSHIVLVVVVVVIVVSVTLISILKDSETFSLLAQAGYRNRVRIADIYGASADDVSSIGSSYTLKGWARTVRTQKSLTFLELNDGSSLSGIQV